MALDIEKYTARYPILWHVTTGTNAKRIRRTKLLESAAVLMRASGNLEYVGRPRDKSVELFIDGETVVLRDQLPLLRQGQVTWEGGWTMETLIDELNRRVFFWPGTTRGPIEAVAESVAAFETWNGVVWIGLPYERVRRVPGVTLHYCRYNSGGPRRSPQRGPVPRGPDLFLPHGRWGWGPAAVREVAALDSIPLGGLWDAVTFSG